MFNFEKSFNKATWVSGWTSSSFGFLFWWLLVWKILIHKDIFLQVYLSTFVGCLSRKYKLLLVTSVIVIFFVLRSGQHLKNNYRKIQESYLKQANSGGESTLETGWFLFLLLLAVITLWGSSDPDRKLSFFGLSNQRTEFRLTKATGKRGENLKTKERQRNAAPNSVCKICPNLWLSPELCFHGWTLTAH